MTKIATEEQISKILFDIDPMSTCCKVNDGMEDEYLTEARIIINYLHDGYSFADALTIAFGIAFASDSISESDFMKICTTYSELIK